MDPMTASAKDVLLTELVDKVNELEKKINNISIPALKIHYHRDKYKDFTYKIETHGNYYDLAAATRVELKAGEYYKIPLGVSIYLPDGYYAIVCPRSSTFKNYGLLQANSIGIIDTTYRSLKDEYFLAVYATRDIVIEPNKRIAQFSLFKDTDFTITEEEYWEEPERGGFGSTGA